MITPIFWLILTADLKTSIAGEGSAVVVAGEAPVHPRVLLLLAVHRSQEEQAAIREEDPV